MRSSQVFTGYKQKPILTNIMTTNLLEGDSNRPLESPSMQIGTRFWISRSAVQTRWLGQTIASKAQAGDIVCVVGDLGTGKTTFTKGVGVGLGLREDDITSPSFSIVAEHRYGRIKMYHLDVYRLTSPTDLSNLGFDDYLSASDGLIVIEWADLVADIIPSDRLVITLTAGPKPNERQIRAQEHGPASRRLLEAAP